MARHSFCPSSHNQITQISSIQILSHLSIRGKATDDYERYLFHFTTDHRNRIQHKKLWYRGESWNTYFRKKAILGEKFRDFRRKHYMPTTNMRIKPCRWTNPEHKIILNRKTEEEEKLLTCTHRYHQSISQSIGSDPSQRIRDRKWLGLVRSEEK